MMYAECYLFHKDTYKWNNLGFAELSIEQSDETFLGMILNNLNLIHIYIQADLKYVPEAKPIISETQKEGLLLFQAWICRIYVVQFFLEK